MSVKILSKSDLPSWIQRLDEVHHLVGPKPVQSQYVFAEFHSAGEIAIDYPTSALPPKKVLLPPHEDILHFNIEQEQTIPVLPTNSTVVIGVHTCDLHAINLLDEVMLQGFCDQHYQTRRENTTFVTVECLQQCSEHAFCKDMGTYSVPEEFDLHLTDIGSAYAIDIGSENGADLLAGCMEIRDADDQDYKNLNRVMSKKWANFPYKLDIDISELRALMKVSQKSILWEELGTKCLGCGSCTLVCPTCYCFDIRDEIDLTLNQGKRYRIWDSCQLDAFAEVAGGHDFRAGGANRQRHRFMRKYRYQSISDGLLGCVGCGRCGLACLVNISPVPVLNTLNRRRPAVTVKEAAL